MENFNLPSITFASKSEIASAAESDAKRVIENGQTLDAIVAISAMIEYCEQLKAGIKDEALKAADELCGAKSTAEYKGAKIQYKEGAARYDFKGIKEIEQLEAKVKQLKELCKAASEDTPVVMPTTHEIVKGVKKVYSPSTISVILNK